MRIAQFIAVAHPLVAPRILEENDLISTLPMYTRISEWVEVEFPQLPANDYRPRQLETLAKEEEELRQRLNTVAAARASLQAT